MMREELYRTTFVPSKDESYLSQFRPEDRPRVPDYGWAVLNNYEDLVPPQMSTEEKQYRWNLSTDELKQLLSKRHNYTAWEINEVKKRQRSKKPEHKIRPCVEKIYSVDIEGEYCMRTMIFERAEHEAAIRSLIGSLISYHHKSLCDFITECQKTTIKSITAMIVWNNKIMPYLTKTAAIREEVFELISDRDYESNDGIVRVDYADIVHILSHSTIIDKETCSLLLPVISHAHPLTESFAYARSLMFIAADLSTGASWVKQRADGTYSMRPFTITKEFFIAAMAALYGDRHELRDTAEWRSARRVLMYCKKHGESLVYPRTYLAGKNCCSWDFAAIH